MIEIQADSEKLIKFFKERSYTIYNDELIEIFNHSDYERIKTANIFFKYNK